MSELADWLVHHASGLFSNGDAFLGAPRVTASMSRQWTELSRRFEEISPNNWLDHAKEWLEVTGTTVPVMWQEQWAKVTWDRPVDEVATSPQGDALQQLARRAQHFCSLQRSFDRRLHKSKLAALKQLAYGLSHEINNPLANISTRAQGLQREETDGNHRQILQKIVDQVYRAHAMIADLMFYANPPLARPSVVDLNELVVSVMAEYDEEVQQLGIRTETHTVKQPLRIPVDSLMISDAMRVLIRNSIEAIGIDGTIVVSTAAENQHVVIHIADSGPGLSHSARQHAFDPYFSGREAGRGLGLGLCRAYRIAKLHNAEITLAGGPIGCVATIRLPLDKPYQ